MNVDLSKLNLFVECSNQIYRSFESSIHFKGSAFETLLSDYGLSTTQ